MVTCWRCGAGFLEGGVHTLSKRGILSLTSLTVFHEIPQLDEDKVIDLVEKSCNPEKEEGNWISKIDLIEKNGDLRLSEQKDVGKCKRECLTISKACEESVAEVDTDLAELLWKNKLSLSKLINEVCYSMSSACKGKTVKLKTGERKIDETFHVLTEDEKKADEILKQMR